MKLIVRRFGKSNPEPTDPPAPPVPRLELSRGGYLGKQNEVWRDNR